MKVAQTDGTVKDEVSLTGSNAAKKYEQKTVTTAQTITREPGASCIEIYVESGAVRVRTDGSAATSTLGQPMGEGYSERYAVPSLSIIATSGTSVIEVIHR